MKEVITLEVLNVNDGCISLTISDDAMEVWARFTPSLGSGLPLPVEKARKFLKENGVVYGVHLESIGKSIQECEQEKKPVNQMLACGDPPFPEVPAYFEMRAQFDPSRKNGIVEDKNAKIDYRDFSPFTIVQKDTQLAILRPEVVGKNGFNVYGIELPFVVTPHDSIEVGKNIRVEKHALYADVHGQLLLKDNVLNVEDTLEIKGSVGYATGHIDFPGDILIHGYVNDGFKICSGGSITCMQTLDVTRVSVAGALKVSGGIIGRQEAAINVSAESQMRFIDHCHFSSQGNMNVGDEILDSVIYTRGKLVMGSGSSIVASSIHSIHSVFVDKIENRTGRVSSFSIGIDFVLMKSVEERKKRLATITRRLDEIKARVRDTPSDKRGYFNEVLARIEERWLVETQALDSLLAQFYADEEAVLQVDGEIAAGTHIEICQATYTVLSPLKRVCFKLSENKKHIITAKYDETAKPVERLKLLHGRRQRK